MAKTLGITGQQRDFCRAVAVQGLQLAQGLINVKINLGPKFSSHPLLNLVIQLRWGQFAFVGQEVVINQNDLFAFFLLGGVNQGVENTGVTGQVSKEKSLFEVLCGQPHAQIILSLK